MLFADNTWWHIYVQICRHTTILVNPSPCFSPSHHPIPFYTSQSLYLLTWRTSFSCSWCKYPSTLVPGLLSTVLPLLLHPPQGTPQIKLRVHIDNINNISRLVWYNYYDICNRARILKHFEMTAGHKFACKIPISGQKFSLCMQMFRHSDKFKYIQNYLHKNIFFQFTHKTFSLFELCYNLLPLKRLLLSKSLLFSPM